MLPPLLAGPSWRETPGHFSTQPGEKTSSVQSPSPARTFCPELRFPGTSEHMIQTSCSRLGFPEASHRCQQHGLSRLPWPTPEECPGVRSKDSNSPPHSWMLPSPDVKGIPLPTDNGLISRMQPKWSQVPQARNPGLPTSLPWRGGSFPEHHTGRRTFLRRAIICGDPPVALSPTQLVFALTPEETGAIFLKLETAPESLSPR